MNMVTEMTDLCNQPCMSVSVYCIVPVGRHIIKILVTSSVCKTIIKLEHWSSTSEVPTTWSWKRQAGLHKSFWH